MKHYRITIKTTGEKSGVPLEYTMTLNDGYNLSTIVDTLIEDCNNFLGVNVDDDEIISITCKPKRKEG